MLLDYARGRRSAPEPEKRRAPFRPKQLQAYLILSVTVCVVIVLVLTAMNLIAREGRLRDVARELGGLAPGDELVSYRMPGWGDGSSEDVLVLTPQTYARIYASVKSRPASRGKVEPRVSSEWEKLVGQRIEKFHFVEDSYIFEPAYRRDYLLCGYP